MKMAISPKELAKLSEAQKKKIDDLEIKIDKSLKENYAPGVEFEYPINQPLNHIEQFWLEMRYIKVGWDASFSGKQDGPLTLTLEYAEEKFRDKT